MISQKSQSSHPHGEGWFNREFKLLGLFLCIISFSNLILSNNTSALFVPTLSASVDQANLQVNGNQVINSTDRTTEIPFNFTVNTNNRTGYTATLSAETENTALTNISSTTGAKIDSVNVNLTLNNLPNNTWGYKFGSSTNYAPIPALSSPAQILQTAGKTNGNESNSLSVGMKLSENLESGNYQNKLILSFVSNPYQMRAMMTNGSDFNSKLHGLETTTNKIEHFVKGSSLPDDPTNVINIEDANSDYEIKAWFDSTNKTAYYYTNTETIRLHPDCQGMFMLFKKMKNLDLENFDTSIVENMHTMFDEMWTLESINLSNFDTRNVRTMHAMFNADFLLKNLNLSSFQTNNVSDMAFMFADMSKLRELNISNFDTSRVTDMMSMFSDMRSLTSLDLSNFDTSKVTNMDQMFLDMSDLTSLDISNFDTSNVTNMRNMFGGVKRIDNLDLSHFNTSKVTDMSYMFSGMTNLISLDLSNFDTSKVKNMYAMFSSAFSGDAYDKLEKIYVNNDFNTTNLTDFSYMFFSRKKLRGGAGSFLSDPSTADKSWLRIDDPTNGRPGYFTRKP
mgnify:CR=1 FL=1|jgi:bacterial surface protein 26-residue repeat/bacterial surface protein 26-residue repeat/bacterial surface protein 26-residue repeat/bacterial surface protein 26-residue repeat/bacterial surface protein 26-residue repeat/bacterial surface protein 26-residue repeat